MSLNPLSVFSNATFGMNMVGDEALFHPSLAGRFVWWARNLRIENGQWTTRYAWVEQSAQDTEALAAWHAAPTQGAILYQPHVGQGAHYQGIGPDRLVESAGGQLFTLTPGPNGTFEVALIPGATVTPRWALAWLEQAENYILRSDGSSSVVIWDGQNPASFSSGFSRSFPAAAKIPNGAGPILYHQNRLWVTVADRQVWPGDVLHKADQLDAVDLLSFEDQAIDNTSVLIISPSSLVALSPATGQDLEEIHAHGIGPSIEAISIPQALRSEWANTRLQITRSRETAAAGPYAIAVRDGGSLHRSAKGIEDARIIVQDQRALGYANHNLGKGIEPILAADYEPDLLFASLVNPPTWDRMLCTVGPWTDGPRRAHRGLMVANWNPGQTETPQGQFAWEGAISLPPQFGEIVQLIEGRVNGRHRIYALTWDGSQKHLLEWTRTDGPDRDAAGNALPIEWMLISRKLIAESEYTKGDWKAASLRLKDVLGPFHWEAWLRTDRELDWRAVKKGATRSTGCNRGEDVIPLGNLDSHTSRCRWVQFMVRGLGHAKIDLAVTPNAKTSPDESGAGRDCLPPEKLNQNLFAYQL